MGTMGWLSGWCDWLTRVPWNSFSADFFPVNVPSLLVCAMVALMRYWFAVWIHLAWMGKSDWAMIEFVLNRNESSSIPSCQPVPIRRWWAWKDRRVFKWMIFALQLTRANIVLPSGDQAEEKGNKMLITVKWAVTARMMMLLGGPRSWEVQEQTNEWAVLTNCLSMGFECLIDFLQFKTFSHFCKCIASS